MASSTISPATLRRLRRLSLRQLLYFVELERHRNFGRAAIALGVSQPTLSQQIGQLEEVMGVTLISRGTRRFMLTEPGEVVLARARKALNLLAETIEAIGSDQAEEPLHLGIPNYTTYPIVAEALRRFRTVHPQAIPHLIELGAEEMSQQLNDGELDAGFLSVPTPTRLVAHMESMTIWQAPTLVCLPKKHPFAALSAAATASGRAGVCARAARLSSHPL